MFRYFGVGFGGSAKSWFESILQLEIRHSLDIVILARLDTKLDGSFPSRPLGDQRGYYCPVVDAKSTVLCWTLAHSRIWISTYFPCTEVEAKHIEAEIGAFQKRAVLSILS